METFIQIAKDALAFFNDVPNFRLRHDRSKSSYDLAAHIGRCLKEHEVKDFDDSERAYILEQAKKEWASDDCEIFEDSLVTESPDEGAWIEAKVFIRLERCANPDCKAIEGTEKWGTVGDGYDGYCPSCADKREGGEE